MLESTHNKSWDRKYALKKEKYIKKTPFLIL